MPIFVSHAGQRSPRFDSVRSPGQLAAGKLAEARAVYAHALKSATEARERVSYRDRMSGLFTMQGDYAAALRELEVSVKEAAAAGLDTLLVREHLGMAINEGLAGHAGRVGSHIAASRAAASQKNVQGWPFLVTLTAMAYIAANQNESAVAVLDRGEIALRAQGDTANFPVVKSYRALAAMRAGHCADAQVILATKAATQGNMLDQVVRATCAERDGHHAQAVAIRDSVLSPAAGPSWSRGMAMHFARQVGR